MSKTKLLKKYRIKYGLDKGKKKKFIEDGNGDKHFVKSSNPKIMTTYNQFKSRSKNPKPQMDVETLNNGVSSLSYKDVVIKKMKWKKSK
jgi:hypothetical protein